MKEILRNDRIWLVLIGIFAGAALPARAEVTCTATPDCAGLGYTKSASQCPDGGVKCPFDASKMFCVASGDVDFTFKNKIAIGHIAYSDGATSSTYNSSKLAIGIVVYVHPNGKGDHGLIISLDQPVAATRAEAIKRCAGYAIKGTKAGDWHLPDMGELALLSNGNSNMYNQIVTFMAKVPGGHRLGYSYSAFYRSDGSAADYYGGKSYLYTAPDYSSSGVYGYYNASYYWSRSDNFTTTANWLYTDLSSTVGLQSNNRSTYYGQFRCVAEL